MSLLIIEVLPQGMVFAADRNVTVSKEFRRDKKKFVFQAQEPGSKILNWPHGRGLLGTVGLGQIQGRDILGWLYDFMGDHIEFADPKEVAQELAVRLQAAIPNPTRDDGLIVEFGAFAKRDGITVPEMWHVSNVHGMTADKYDPPTSAFGASEEILGNHLKNIGRRPLRDYLRSRAEAYDPFWFHQGISLTIFNTLEEGVKAAFRALQSQGELRLPATLRDWERHARMRVLIYGAFFEAFGEAGEKFVGGGADALSIPWPDQ